MLQAQLPPSDLSDSTVDSPPLSPSSATHSSIASSHSSYSLGELSSHSFRKFVHDTVASTALKDSYAQEPVDVNMQHLVDRGHEALDDHTEGTSNLRPPMPRQPSYSKRHSSFDTPRQVPLPYGYLDATLPDYSGPSPDPRHERSTVAPMNTSGDPKRRADSTSNGQRDPFAGRSNGGSPPPRQPEQRISTSSLPLPSSTPYSTLPKISSTSPSPFHGVTTPPSPPSSLTATVVPTSRSTTSKASGIKLDSLNFSSPASPPYPTHLPRLPESPTLDADEPNINEAARSTDLRPSQDVRSYHFPSPPRKYPSSPSSIPSPSYRPMSSRSVNASSTSSEGSSPFPPPEPPTILAPPLPLSDAEKKARKPAPHEPFLPRDQLPLDHTYIAVETVPEEYRLLVRLPGFQRDSITLAMRRRRILHVVADNWSDDGGHFERRISFGYDADLATVKAEFDGEILRIVVPRREPPGRFPQPTH